VFPCQVPDGATQACRPSSKGGISRTGNLLVPVSRLNLRPDCIRQLVVRLYLDPPAQAVVLSLYEKSQRQVLDRTHSKFRYVAKLNARLPCGSHGPVAFVSILCVSFKIETISLRARNAHQANIAAVGHAYRFTGCSEINRAPDSKINRNSRTV
jgi:hypothetical protein